MRKGVLDIPAMLIFKMLIGLNGVTLATPFAEVVSVITAGFLYNRFRKEVTEEENKSVFS